MTERGTSDGIEIASTDLFGSVTMRVEHRWLCFRTETGWLVESFEIAKFPDCGVSMEDLKTMCERNMPIGRR
jgi:hypothetical protein